MNSLVCSISSPYLLEPLAYIGDPIYYKFEGMYGYLMVRGDDVLFFYYDKYFDRIIYSVLDGWVALR